MIWILITITYRTITGSAANTTDKIKTQNDITNASFLDTNLEISEDSLKGKFIYARPNFAYSDNTLFTSLESTTTDNLSDFGYNGIGLSRTWTFIS